LAELKMTGRYAGYRPNFRAEEFQPGVWWVLDGEVRVGMVQGEFHTLELVNFDPFAPRAVEYPEIYHAPTAPGDRITLANWVEWNQKTTSERNELRFSGAGETLTVQFEEWFAEEPHPPAPSPRAARGLAAGERGSGMHAVKTCTFAVDPDLGYVVRVESRVKSPVAHQVEFANFLPERVVDDRLQRWPFILWQHPDGQILRWNQNNVGADAYGNRDHYGARQIDPEGFLGYFGEADRCPVAEFHGANMPIAAATCHNMLDEHLHWVVGRDYQPPQDEAGLYTYEVAFTLASLPGEVGARLAEQAQVNDLILDRYPAELAGSYPWTREETGPVRPLNYAVFRQGCLCDFTERVEARASDRNQCFIYPEDDPEAPVSVVSEGGRQTGPCLRLNLTPLPPSPCGREGSRIACGPEHGTSLHLTAGTTYRGSAWLKTDLQDGQARLRVWEWLFRPSNLTREYWSAPVRGKSEWTKVAIEFTPEGPRTHCMSVEVVAEGEGTVWVDELLVEAV
jgi:hypothetical protein